LCYLNFFRQNSKFKSEGASPPPEIKVGGLGPCGAPGSATYGDKVQRKEPELAT